ncbi:cytochrome c-type biogenesis protein CcmE [Colwellia chukchiensis]|uniref:Cytochrome c-type biogenesis protein CcmE n=1 Tax=Colwellia chukchiensis TaxID=641665 RepID=A0A1H7HXM9_9GAMM|nr:cytochrome c maturation protein CcmE [Colwellia chukchiensis]SEK55056.1 cytochrome c-type biogenesis protein CcmE [Colwellia chukchiensis]
MNPRRKKRLTIVSTIIIGLGVVAGLVLYALSQNIDLFYKPSEIYHGKEGTGLKAIDGQRLRIGGLVVPGSVHRDSESLKVSFKLADMTMPIAFSESDPTVTVSYDGILPDLFREGQGIVANGILVNGNTIEASEVLAKHDENYMPKELADDLGEQHVKPSYSQAQLDSKT